MSELDEAAKLKIALFRAERGLRTLRRDADEDELVLAEIKRLAARTPQPAKWPQRPLREIIWRTNGETVRGGYEDGTVVAEFPVDQRPDIDGLEEIMARSYRELELADAEPADPDAALEALALFEDIAEQDGADRARAVLAAVKEHLDAIGPTPRVGRPARERRDRRMLAMQDAFEAADAHNPAARVISLFSGDGPFSNGQDRESIRRALIRARKKRASAK